MCCSRGPSIVYANRVHLSITARGALQMLRRIAALKCLVRKIHLLTPGDVPGAAADMSGRAESELVLAPGLLCAFPHPLSIDTLSTKGGF